MFSPDDVLIKDVALQHLAGLVGCTIRASLEKEIRKQTLDYIDESAPAHSQRLDIQIS